MQPQDVYNRQYAATIAVLDRWLDTIRDVAAVDREQAAEYWRVQISPYQLNACPVELMISRNQTFDIDIGSESLAQQPARDLTLLQLLLEAVAAGNVVLRTWSAQATGAELTREVRARLDDGREWTMRRLLHAGSASTELSAVARDRVFVAYRRPLVAAA